MRLLKLLAIAVFCGMSTSNVTGQAFWSAKVTAKLQASLPA